MVALQNANKENFDSLDISSLTVFTLLSELFKSDMEIGILFMQSITKTWLLYTWNDNKRPMGHMAHLRKQFKSINTYYDYIITLIKRRKKPIFYFMRI